MSHPRLPGVYAGRVTAAFAKGLASVIHKSPLHAAVALGPLGLAGDEQADPKNHGARNAHCSTTAWTTTRAGADNTPSVPPASRRPASART